MDKDRLLKEAQLIASEFSFFTVKGELGHLYGYIYKSPDGQTKYPLEIIYDEGFPENPPQLNLPQEIPNFSEDIQLNSIKNWKSDDSVIMIVRELSDIIKKSITESVKTTEIEPELKDKTVPKVLQEDSGVVQETPSEILQDDQSSTNSEEEYITPNMGEYPDGLDESLSNPEEYPEWSPDDLNDQKSDEPELFANVESEENIPFEPSFEESSEADVLVATEAALIQQEYAMDYVGNSAGIVEIYLTITLEQTFVIQIDFSDYPKRPKLEFQVEGLKSLLGDVNESLEILSKWNEKKPSHVFEIIRELESKLWFLSEIENESKKVSGSYKTELIGNLISNLTVSLFTYGFKEYTLAIDISKYPELPLIKFSPELGNLIKISVEELSSYKNWRKKDSHPVEILEEISWLVDKNSRINFEVDLLKGGLKDVKYEESSNTIYAKLAGQMKTKDLTFEIEAVLPENYPMSAPNLELKTELEGMEDIKEKLIKQIDDFTKSWHPFNYLIDLYNKISKTIFEVSVVSCVICHQIDCPSCSSKISLPNNDEGGEECQVMCPSCERLYHKHCWDQTILSFGKCGFCLRPPPANLRPT